MDASTLWYIAQGVVWTVAITVLSFLFGALGGVGVAGARVSAHRWIRIIARGVVDSDPQCSAAGVAVHRLLRAGRTRVEVLAVPVRDHHLLDHRVGLPR
jgi:hypothetical protein